MRHLRKTTAHGRRRRGSLLLLGVSLGSLLASALDASDLASGDPRRGEPLYRQYCAVCHGATGEGDGPNAASMEDDRPRDLTDARYMARLIDTQLVEVIRGGGGAVGRSRFMPAWGNTLSAEQVADLVAYIRTLWAQPQRTAPATPDMLEAAGARLVAELGCTGCHRIGDLPAPPVAPDLSSLATKVQPAWLEAYLLRPRRIRPAGYVPLSRSRMPDFRLSVEESRQLAAYVDRLRPKAEPPIGSAPAAAEKDGEKLFLQLACRACHTFEGRGGQSGPDLSAVPQRLQTPWVARYILDPQGIDPRSPMPRPGITPGEAWALTATLQGGAAASSPGMARASEGEEGQATRGGSLFRDLACRACHRRSDDDVPERVGPDLTFIGDKLRSKWIAGYLRQPHPVRPWLQARMPTFVLSDTEVDQITAFLVTLRDRWAPPLPAGLLVASPPSSAVLQAGERLATKEYLSCSSCHLGGDREPEGKPEELAPDLRLAGRRLQPQWIVRWLLDPQRLFPGTKMPSYFSDADSGPHDILDGDELRQILAIRDHLLAIGTAPSGPTP